MSRPPLKPTSRQNPTMKKPHFKEKRRSDRIALTLPIKLQGTTATGAQFEEYTTTVVVGRNGAQFGSKTALYPMQKIRIQNVRQQTEALFRVVGEVAGPDSDVTLWGVEALKPSLDFWGVYFPALGEGEEATARILLRCRKCKGQELCYLSEVETEVFSLAQRVHHHCKTCGDWTEWSRPEMGKEGEPREAVPKAREKKGRVHRRVSLRMQACIRTREGGEEVVGTANVSPGGLAVRSKKEYLKDVLVKVAFPYQPGGVNIFVLGRIVKVSTTEEPGTFLYGIQYLF